MKDYCVTCAQMKILEQNTDAAGLSYYGMMENAGRIAANRIVEITMKSPNNDGRTEPLRALVYCGKGNNGGDGFVVARRLCREGWDVSVVLVDGEPVTPDAITNYSLLADLQIPVSGIGVSGRESASEQEEVSGQEGGNPSHAKPYDVIVDAIYGTGFHGKLRPAGAEAAARIADAKAGGAVVFALDIPSGMSGDLTDRSELDERCVRADYTITFHAKKPVHLQPFAEEFCGEIITADIGIVDEDRPAFAKGDGFEEFVDIVAKLRAPDGCPWDRAQTHETLKKYFLEETGEAVEAIDNHDDENLCEELGDVLLQIVLHAQIASEGDRFNIDDVIRGISQKMIRRHPWVFGDEKVSTPEEGEKLWEEIKKKEKEAAKAK